MPMNPTMHLRHSQRGVTLIELMIALVVGLIVSGAALALVAAIIKSNADTVRSTRLTQELRATAEVIARDMMRARGVNDPISNLNVATTKSCDTITTSTAGCIQFGYDCDSSTSGIFVAYGLVGNSVYQKASTTGMPACPTASDTKISSDTVSLTTTTGLAFAQIGTTDAYTITVTGQLAYKPSVSNTVTLSPITRSYTQTVRVRSVSVN